MLLIQKETLAAKLKSQLKKEQKQQEGIWTGKI